MNASTQSNANNENMEVTFNFKNHLKIFSKWEAFFIIASISLIWILTIIPLFYVEDSVYWLIAISLFASMFGIVSNFLAIKKTKYNYLWGIVHVLLYGLVAFFGMYYGDAILNWVYYLPLMIFGYFLWKKNEFKEGNNGQVQNKKLDPLSFAIFTLLAVLFFVLYLQLLKFIGGVNVYLDSLSTTLSLYGMLLMNYRYREQWLIWFSVNIVSMVMWILLLFNIDGNSTTTGLQVFAIPMILMWTVYLFVSIYGWINWRKVDYHFQEVVIK